MIYVEIILMIQLIIISIQDIRKKEVSAILLFGMGLVAVIGTTIQLIVGDANWLSILLGIVPGIALFIISSITEELLGKADGLVLAFVGCVLDIRRMLIAMTITFTLMMVTSIILLVLKRVSKNDKLAMVPFIALGMVGAILCGRL